MDIIPIVMMLGAILIVLIKIENRVISIIEELKKK